MSDVETGTLLIRTKELLATSGKTYLDIHSETGLTPHWLSFLANGKIANPSVNKVQRLYECLRGTKLAV